MSLPLATTAPKATKQTALSAEIIKQHPGLVQVTRRVKVRVPTSSRKNLLFLLFLLYTAVKPEYPYCN